MEDEILIHYEGVEICRDKAVVLQDVNLEVCKGEFIYIIGKVGTGKAAF